MITSSSEYDITEKDYFLSTSSNDANIDADDPYHRHIVPAVPSLNLSTLINANVDDDDPTYDNQNTTFIYISHKHDTVDNDDPSSYDKLSTSRILTMQIFGIEKSIVYKERKQLHTSKRD